MSKYTSMSVSTAQWEATARRTAAVVLATLLACLTACSPASATVTGTTEAGTTEASTTAPAAEATSGTGSAESGSGATAAEVLGSLPVKGRAPKTGYERSLFGQTWADVDRNGCDTRNDILQRDLTAVTFTNSVPCKVQSGNLADPYTGTSIDFVRGTTTSSAVQIDHVVALSDAWQKGAQQLTEEQRTAFANDPLNLQATDGPTNMQKGDGDAATWLPPSKGFRCEYVARQVSVKARYSLWVTQSEHDAIANILAGCPGQPAPTAVNRTAPAAVYYASCTEVKAAGAAPLHAGSPGYRSGLDGDADGVACEG